MTQARQNRPNALPGKVGKAVLLASLALGFSLALAQGSVAPAAPSNSASPPPVLAGVQIERAEFGVFQGLSTDHPVLLPQRVVQRDGQPIGWVIQLKTDKPEVTWREEFILPETPKRWAIQPSPFDVRPPYVSADKLRASIERRTVPKGGNIHNRWQLDPTDPAGTYTMQVYIDNTLVANFQFEVQ